MSMSSLLPASVDDVVRILDTVPMPSVPLTTTALTAAGLSLVSYYLFKKPANLPPRPLTLPIVGSVPFVFIDPHIKFTELAKKHGDVMSYYGGKHLVIVLSSAEAIREAFVKHADIMSGRPTTYLIKTVMKFKGVAATDGALWKEQRKVTMQILKDFGMFKMDEVEHKINDAIDPLLEYFSNNSGKPIEPTRELQRAAAAVIGDLVFGPFFDPRCPEWEQFFCDLVDRFPLAMRMIPLENFPPFRYLPGDLFGHKFVLTSTLRSEDYIIRSLRNHRGSFDGKDIRDFIDAYLVRMEQVKDDPDDYDKGYYDANLYRVILDLFDAGTDTTSTTIRWAALYLANFPDIQDRVQQEILDVCGKQRPTLDQRPMMPFCEATIMEVMRHSSVLPIAIPHRNIEAFKFRGYDIPKDTIIIPNLWGVHHDERYFDDPHEFKPERFLDADGQVTTRNEAFMPFGIGRRACLGDALARMEAFLFFTNVFQKFAVSFSEGSNPGLKGKFHLALSPPDHQIILTLRK